MRALLGLAAAGAAGCLAGCAGGEGFETETHVHASLRCVDDSPACVSQRQHALKGMLSDPQRRWVREPADANAYATGVRLFAFKSRKRDLNCSELAIGRREAEVGPATLRGATGRHLTPAQVSRGVMLASEVSRELHAEMRRRRCTG